MHPSTLFRVLFLAAAAGLAGCAGLPSSNDPKSAAEAYLDPQPPPDAVIVSVAAGVKSGDISREVALRIAENKKLITS